MKVSCICLLSFLLGFLLFPLPSNSSEVGTALPPSVVSYMTKRFRTINPDLTIDPAYKMHSLAKAYVNCSFDDGVYDEELIMDNHVVGYAAFVEYQSNYTKRIRSWNDLYEPIIARWIEKQKYNTQIMGAKKYGCAVTTHCHNKGGRRVISCAFYPSSEWIPPPDYYDEEEETTPETTTSTTTTTTTPSIEDYFEMQADEPMSHKFKNCVAIPRAFTEYEKESLVEMSNTVWDDSFFLENLSAFDVTCALLIPKGWKFERAKHYAANKGKRIEGAIGHVLNRGSNTEAILKVIERLRLPAKHTVGCSVIPDCLVRDRIFVLVSCVYEV